MKNKLLAIPAFVSALVVSMAAAASAQEVETPTEQITSLAETGLGSVTPIILAVAGIAVTIAAVRFGVRFVLRAVGSGGRAT